MESRKVCNEPPAVKPAGTEMFDFNRHMQGVRPAFNRFGQHEPATVSKAYFQHTRYTWCPNVSEADEQGEVCGRFLAAYIKERNTSRAPCRNVTALTSMHFLWSFPHRVQFIPWACSRLNICIQ